MGDVLISDTLAMTRGLDEFRHLDQQERALAERMAAKAAEKQLMLEKKDVEEAERSVTDHYDQEGGGREHHGSGHGRKEEKPQPATVEMDEGHLLDLKA